MSTPRRRSSPAAPQSTSPLRAGARLLGNRERGETGEGTLIEPSDDPTALIESLGPPPFPGGDVAQHYFDAIYERAAALAFALATAAGFAAPSEPSAEPPEA